MSGWELAGRIVVSVVAPLVVVSVLTAVFKLVPTRRRNAKLDVLREVIRTDSQMFANCLRLAVEHFRALNRLRDGGPR